MTHNTKRNIAIQNIVDTLKRKGCIVEYSTFGNISGYSVKYNDAYIADILWDNNTEYMRFSGGVIIPLFPADKRKGVIYDAYRIGVNSVNAYINGEDMTEVENRMRRIIS